MRLIGADSIVSSQVYEIIKTIYSTTANETTTEGRIKVLQSTLGQLRLNNIATLDALMTHFVRLIDLTSADEEYISALAQTLAPCILRPRVENPLTMNERHSYRLIRDLFQHKDAIFGELKRQSTANSLGAGSGSSRPRAISTDESNRRAAMEARNRAIVSRSRANSPAPPTTRHRRDRSTDGSQGGRFPINVSGVTPSPGERRHQSRRSLEVPDATTLMPQAPAPSSSPAPTAAPAENGTSTENTSESKPQISVATNVAQQAAENDAPSSAPALERKRDSIGRGRGSRSLTEKVAAFEARQQQQQSSSPPTTSKPDAESGSGAMEERRGVTLEDKPMDD